MDRDIALILICFACLIVSIVGLAILGDSYACGKRSGMMGLSASYGPIQGCMVRVGSRYAPIEYIRIVDDKVIIQGDGE